MELEGFAAVMETVRNDAAGLKDRAIAGPHDYEQIPALVERGRQRIADFYADLEARLKRGRRSSPASGSASPTSPPSSRSISRPRRWSLPMPDANAATQRWYAPSARPSFAA